MALFHANGNRARCAARSEEGANGHRRAWTAPGACAPEQPTPTTCPLGRGGKDRGNEQTPGPL
eukprot:738293-Lingulodinium_polyedra.AAC.1